MVVRSLLRQKHIPKFFTQNVLLHFSHRVAGQFGQQEQLLRMFEPREGGGYVFLDGFKIWRLAGISHQNTYNSFAKVWMWYAHNSAF